MFIRFFSSPLAAMGPFQRRQREKQDYANAHTTGQRRTDASMRAATRSNDDDDDIDSPSPLFFAARAVSRA